MAWPCGRKPMFWVPGLEADHPLALGLVLAAPLTEVSPQGSWRAFDVVGSVQAVRGNRRRRAGRAGLGAAHGGGANTAIEWANRSGFTASSLTAAVLVEYGGTRSSDAPWICRGNAEPWEIRETFSAGQWQVVGRVRLADGSTRQVSVSAGEMLPGRLSLAVLRIRAVARWVRLDLYSGSLGHLWAETTWPAGQMLQGSTANVSLGDLPGMSQTGTSGWQGLVQAGWLWGRTLCDGEVQVLARNPYGMFRRSRPRRLALLMGGMVPPTGSGPRRRVWGSPELYAGAASMRPAGSVSVYVVA